MSAEDSAQLNTVNNLGAKAHPSPQPRRRDRNTQNYKRHI